MTVDAVDAVAGPVVRTDQVTLGVLISQVSREEVDAAVAVCGVRGAGEAFGRQAPRACGDVLDVGVGVVPRLLSDDDYEEVATRVTGSLDRFGCWDAGWSVPTSSAITQARKRLGRDVFAEVFERCCGPVAGQAGSTAGFGSLGTARGAFLRGWRVLAIDGFEVDLPDSAQNGRVRVRRVG